MLYEIRLIAYFETEDPINDIKDKILGHWHDTTVINPGTPNQEFSSLDILKNHHDENPNQPCDLIYHIDNCPLQPD